MPGAGLTMEFSRKALSDKLTLKPYWGKPAVRNFRGGDGDIGIIRSPVCAIALLDRSLHVRRPETAAPANICERRDTGVRRETASQRRNPPQLTELRHATNGPRRRGFPRRRAVRGCSSFWP